MLVSVCSATAQSGNKIVSQLMDETIDSNDSTLDLINVVQTDFGDRNSQIALKTLQKQFLTYNNHFKVNYLEIQSEKDLTQLIMNLETKSKLIIIGHGNDQGLEIAQGSIGWKKLSDVIQKSEIQMSYILGCNSPESYYNLNQIGSFHTKIDAIAGANLIVYDLVQEIGLKPNNDLLKEALLSQEKLNYPLSNPCSIKAQKSKLQLLEAMLEATLGVLQQWFLAGRIDETTFNDKNQKYEYQLKDIRLQLQGITVNDILDCVYGTSPVVVDADEEEADDFLSDILNIVDNHREEDEDDVTNAALNSLIARAFFLTSTFTFETAVYLFNFDWYYGTGVVAVELVLPYLLAHVSEMRFLSINDMFNFVQALDVASISEKAKSGIQLHILNYLSTALATPTNLWLDLTEPSVFQTLQSMVTYFTSPYNAWLQRMLSSGIMPRHSDYRYQDPSTTNAMIYAAGPQIAAGGAILAGTLATAGAEVIASQIASTGAALSYSLSSIELGKSVAGALGLGAFAYASLDITSVDASADSMEVSGGGSPQEQIVSLEDGSVIFNINYPDFDFQEDELQLTMTINGQIAHGSLSFEDGNTPPEFSEVDIQQIRISEKYPNVYNYHTGLDGNYIDGPTQITLHDVLDVPIDPTFPYIYISVFLSYEENTFQETTSIYHSLIRLDLTNTDYFDQLFDYNTDGDDYPNTVEIRQKTRFDINSNSAFDGHGSHSYYNDLGDPGSQISQSYLGSSYLTNMADDNWRTVDCSLYPFCVPYGSNGRHLIQMEVDNHAGGNSGSFHVNLPEDLTFDDSVELMIEYAARQEGVITTSEDYPYFFNRPNAFWLEAKIGSGESDWEYVQPLVSDISVDYLDETSHPAFRVAHVPLVVDFYDTNPNMDGIQVTFRVRSGYDQGWVDYFGSDTSMYTDVFLLSGVGVSWKYLINDASQELISDWRPFIVNDPNNDAIGLFDQYLDGTHFFVDFFGLDFLFYETSRTNQDNSYTVRAKGDLLDDGLFLEGDLNTDYHEGPYRETTKIYKKYSGGPDSGDISLLSQTTTYKYGMHSGDKLIRQYKTYTWQRVCYFGCYYTYKYSYTSTYNNWEPHESTFSPYHTVGLYRSLDLVEMGYMSGDGTPKVEQVVINLDIPNSGNTQVEFMTILGDPTATNSWTIFDEYSANAVDSYDATITMTLPYTMFPDNNYNVTFVALMHQDQQEGEVYTTIRIEQADISTVNEKPTIEFSSTPAKGSSIHLTTQVSISLELHDNFGIDQVVLNLNGFDYQDVTIPSSPTDYTFENTFTFENYASTADQYLIITIGVIDIFGNTKVYTASWISLDYDSGGGGGGGPIIVPK